MKKESSIVKQTETAVDDLLELWRRRRLLAIVVIIIVLIPSAAALFQNFVSIRKLEKQLEKVESQRDKAELQLAPFLAVANRSFPDVPNDQRLDALINRFNDAVANAFRYDLVPDNVEGTAALFTAVKFFLDSPDLRTHSVEWHYRRLAATSTKALSSAIPRLAKSRSFRSFLEGSGVKIMVISFEERKKLGIPWPYTGQVLAASNGPILGLDSDPNLHYVLFPNLEMYIDERVLRALEQVHFEFKKLYTESLRDAIQASKAKASFEASGSRNENND